jgi:hypothetical protein
MYCLFYVLCTGVWRAVSVVVVVVVVVVVMVMVMVVAQNNKNIFV